MSAAAVTDRRVPDAAAGRVQQFVAEAVPDRAAFAPHDDDPVGDVAAVHRPHKVAPVQGFQFRRRHRQR
jgi:hypothetical protein